METVIVRNISTSKVFMEDLGIGIGREPIDFSELFELYELKCSKSLAKQAKLGNIVLNNGERDLTAAEMREFFTL